jgi:hypothetical protein
MQCLSLGLEIQNDFTVFDSGVHPKPGRKSRCWI